MCKYCHVYLNTCLIGGAASADGAIDRTINTRRMKIRGKNVGLLELELFGNPGSVSLEFSLFIS